MPQPAQYEPNDERIRPTTSADTIWWTAATFAMRHRRPLGIGAAIVIIGVIVWSVWANLQEKERNEAAVAVAGAREVKDFEGVIARWPGSEAAAQALFNIGHYQFQAADYARAIETYRKFLAQFPKHLLAASAQVGLAASLEATGDIPKAISAYQDLLRNYPNSLHDAEARLAFGRCFEFQNDWQKAKQSYEDVLSSQSIWSTIARERLVVVDRHLRALQAVTPVSPKAPIPAATSPSR